MVRPRGLFVGLCTLDVIQLVDRIPAADEKLTARAQTVAAGGPATNAAATYSHLGGAATLLTGIGGHPLAAGITAELAALGVDIMDLAASESEPPTVSSILVTAATGRRAVASVNASGRRLPLPHPERLADLVAGADTVEFDGHHMELATAVARAARTAGRLTVLDGGSWKPGTDELLPSIDVAVCSADFHPPGTSTPPEVLTFLAARGVKWAAVTQGGGPILWSAGPDRGGELPLPPSPCGPVVDTLGAGDILHGALTYALPGRLRSADEFCGALVRAAGVATEACASFGTRTWMRGRGPGRGPGLGLGRSGQGS